MSATRSPAFTFGVEIELLVKPRSTQKLKFQDHGFNDAVQPTRKEGDSELKSKQQRNRTAVRRAVAESMLREDIRATLQDVGFETWTVQEDGSLIEVVDARGGGYWGIEIVSPILHSDSSQWATDLDAVFRAVDRVCETLLSQGCSMHVHLQPCPEWDIVSLRSLAKATAVFDEAIMRIMPAERKMNPWARSNYRDDPLEQATPALKKAFDEVPTKTWKPLFDIFDRIKMRNAFLHTWGQSRSVSWNLAPLAHCGTVEFRRPPGVKTAANTRRWAAFALGFAYAAIQPNWHDQWALSKRHASVEQLRSFVGTGLRLLGWQAFLDPRTLVEDTSPAKTLEWFDIEEVKRKLAKAKRESGYEEKIRRSRENSPASSRPSSSGSHGSVKGRSGSPAAAPAGSHPNSSAA